MVQLIALLPSQCIDSGDIKFIRNMRWLRNAAILELKFFYIPSNVVAQS